MHVVVCLSARACRSWSARVVAAAVCLAVVSTPARARVQGDQNWYTKLFTTNMFHSFFMSTICDDCAADEKAAQEGVCDHLRFLLPAWKGQASERAPAPRALVCVRV